MKTLKFVSLLALMLCAITAVAADMGTSGGFDLDALWAQAQRTYDTRSLDAVVLLEDREVTLEPSGDLATTVHRVVWINSSTAIHEYADLRVPWNSANSVLKVLTLRTWRDDRWWPDPQRISDTAVVETLPYAVDHADDYTAMRETMMLHDGIELPCILETRYTITRRGAPAAAGVFVLAQDDPAVQVQLTVTTPATSPWHATSLNGAPEPTVTTDGGLRRAVWRMESVAALGRPATSEPEAYEPAAAYSTWQDWKAVGQAFSASFDAAAHLGPVLADSVATRTAHLTDTVEIVKAVLDFVTESTRSIHSDSRLWDKPRSADRTWETGYGNAWDRMALAAGAIRSLAVVPNGSGAPSLAANPVFVSWGISPVAPSVPRIDPGWHLVLNIMVGDGEFLEWTNDGTLHGVTEIMGRPTFVPFTGQPVFLTRSEEENRVVANLKVIPTADEGWSWSGILSCQGLFSYHGDVITGKALDKAATAALGDLLPDLDLDSCNPREFAPLQVTVTCDGTLAGPDENQAGEVVLTVGDPGDGVLGRLPRDIHTYQSDRTSAALIRPMQEKIYLQMPLDGFTPVRLPRTLEVDNAAGRFAVSAKVTGGRLYYKRSLRLTGQGSWPELRALLLEAGDVHHRGIVLTSGGGS